MTCLLWQRVNREHLGNRMLIHHPIYVAALARILLLNPTYSCWYSHSHQLVGEKQVFVNTNLRHQLEDFYRHVNSKCKIVPCNYLVILRLVFENPLLNLLQFKGCLERKKNRVKWCHFDLNYVFALIGFVECSLFFFGNHLF